ncbi:OsmC family protein [Granulosicoccus antarcticus]|uniref:OsmC-like protein n=1 Tax=Granulosicoccus antarcticus IMCC3135 TaxID=1192854 RepID=A0A2Z2NMI6_9GAMM|nr:OsmC family protein [Granulosicoccus antarcticus]ASJ71161.1 hypothetical protein IMCC3135_05240 [Granulosicoccus antarcticus IMCC3135]
MTDVDPTAMPSQHDYTAQVSWTGNTGQGTRSYRAYERTWDITTPGKPIVHGSNDPLLGGDAGLHNPEDLLLASVSSCHMLWYLHLASTAGVVVLNYTDNPIGVGEVFSNGAGKFLSVTLHPDITLAQGTDQSRADAIHGQIHQYCFIARSLNFPVSIKASYTISNS